MIYIEEEIVDSLQSFADTLKAGGPVMRRCPCGQHEVYDCGTKMVRLQQYTEYHSAQGCGRVFYSEATEWNKGGA